jgi:hypothetical protein
MTITQLPVPFNVHSLTNSQEISFFEKCSKKNPAEHHENRFRGLRSHLAAAIYFFAASRQQVYKVRARQLRMLGPLPPTGAFGFSCVHPPTHFTSPGPPRCPPEKARGASGWRRSVDFYLCEASSLSLSLLSAPPFWWTFHPRVFFPRFLLRYLLFLHHYSQCVFVSCMRSPCSQHTFPLLLLTLVPLPIGFRCVHRCRPSGRWDAKKRAKNSQKIKWKPSVSVHFQLTCNIRHSSQPSDSDAKLAGDSLPFWRPFHSYRQPINILHRYKCIMNLNARACVFYCYYRFVSSHTQRAICI